MAAGNTFGPARSAEVIAVQVLDAEGQGSLSDIIQGLEWAVQDAKMNRYMPGTVVMKYVYPY